jgi:acetyl-CoA C-acetyltransferase
MYAPVVAMDKLQQRTGKETGSYDLAEVNEAFSSAACAVTQEAGLHADRTNVNGGAVALGHPIGASGARILTTLLYAMQNREKHTGLATLCLGGGNAVAVAVSR